MCSVGSRFCNSAESNYSPTDGEFTALVDALEKTAYFTLGCSDLTVGTDHKPLISIVNETSLGEIKTPRQQRLKERLMRWNLKAVYIPGKHLGGTDALSRYGVRKPTDETAYRIFSHSLATASEEHSLTALVSDLPPVTSSDVVMATDGDNRVSAGYLFSISILIKSPLHTLPYKVCINHLKYTYFCLEIPKHPFKV